ncbi:Zinc-ribbon containing domain-containing protein [Paenibacillus uliginis N3/975]|uniref:Zinc-ribbon containing domain-containing protein n=1 Tax=Paenibacillus uliginis N3/975 TaxID=1313296 RepID=A0A1X7GKX6_9BACL|nr:YgzB family protein [Paenibacillus uliginis]SMF71314.1 Zinc-ribbon containing domain-containing protein [Paenibacillus uliginis N3/975]
MIFKTAKINAFRTWGLLLTMIGMGLMVLGTAGIVFWGQAGKVVAGIGLVLGLITMMGSLGIYFWAGMLSTSAVQIQCPDCAKQTKMLGKTDRCMFCRTMLTLDPNIANVTAEELEAQHATAKSSDASETTVIGTESGNDSTQKV